MQSFVRYPARPLLRHFDPRSQHSIFFLRTLTSANTPAATLRTTLQSTTDLPARLAGLARLATRATHTDANLQAEELRELRREEAQAQGYRTEKMGKDKSEKKGAGFNLKVPKGTRDCASSLPR